MRFTGTDIVTASLWSFIVGFVLAVALRVSSRTPEERLRDAHRIYIGRIEDARKEYADELKSLPSPTNKEQKP